LSITVNTTPVTNTECQGTDYAATNGTFTTGYNYSFRTEGTDVIATFELLDNRTGVQGYAWTYNPNFAETSMTANGKIVTKTFSGQTLGAAFKMACKFAYAGGMSVTKYFDYVVGSNCDATAVEKVVSTEPFFYPNPVQDMLQLETGHNETSLNIYDIIGHKVFSGIVPASFNLNVSHFKPGIYFIVAESKDKILKGKIIKN
jgi:hypothetical protein